MENQLVVEGRFKKLENLAQIMLQGRDLAKKEEGLLENKRRIHEGSLVIKHLTQGSALY